MQYHELTFARILIHRKDIAEVIVNDGVELNMEMVEQFHQFLLSYLHAPFSVLVNKLNAYTYTFEAQKSLGKLAQLRLIAVVAYTPVAQISTEMLGPIFERDIGKDLKIFNDHQQALYWLISEQDSTTN